MFLSLSAFLFLKSINISSGEVKKKLYIKVPGQGSSVSVS